VRPPDRFVEQLERRLQVVRGFAVARSRFRGAQLDEDGGERVRRRWLVERAAEIPYCRCGRAVRNRARGGGPQRRDDPGLARRRRREEVRGDAFRRCVGGEQGCAARSSIRPR